MNKPLSITFIFLFITLLSFGQSLDSLKLDDKEIPEGYKSLNELQCKSIQATLLFKNIEMYSSILGKVTKKEFQTLVGKEDQGSILYFEFEKPLEMEAFLGGLLWGEPSKPTKSHPEECKVKNNILIVWSFNKDSQIKTLSKEKVLKRL